MKSPKTVNRKTKTVEQSNPMENLREKLKACDPEIQYFIIALEKENLNCSKKVAKLQAENVKLNGWITILEEDTNKRCIHKEPPVECLEKKIEQLEELSKVIEEKQNELKPKLK